MAVLIKNFLVLIAVGLKEKRFSLSFKAKDKVSENARLISNPLANNKAIETIKIEIFSNKGDSKSF